jgi:hypothetical protein
LRPSVNYTALKSFLTLCQVKMCVNTFFPLFPVTCEAFSMQPAPTSTACMHISFALLRYLKHCSRYVTMQRISDDLFPAKFAQFTKYFFVSCAAKGGSLLLLYRKRSSIHCALCL